MRPVRFIAFEKTLDWWKLPRCEKVLGKLGGDIASKCIMHTRCPRVPFGPAHSTEVLI
jgi:hypothetical protein